MLNNDQVGPSTFDPELSQFAPPTIPFARPIGFAYPPEPFLLFSMPRGAAWADLGLIAAAMIVVELLTFVGIQIWLAFSGHAPVAGDMPPEIVQQIMGPILGTRALATCLIVALLVKMRRLSAASVGLKTRGLLMDALLGVAATPIAYMAIIMTIMSVWFFWPKIVEEMQENAEQLTGLIPALSPLGFLVVALIIGIYEELLFRGFLMTRLRRATGSWIISVVLTTVVFTVLHAFEQTKGALITIAVLSLFFSLLTVWRRSIVPAIVAHALFDFSQFLLLQATTTAPPPPLSN